ncbi:DEAD-box ATP-dependent RNA helicase 47A [Arachis hypogaea]|nr:DEAD-box ATP-dependent RNA helicase 47A [Arachis hypogaea]
MMPALMPSRFFLLVGESFPIRRALATHKNASSLLHISIHCMSQVEPPNHGSLTLSSVSFQSEVDKPINKGGKSSSKVKPLLGSSPGSLKSKGIGKHIGSSKKKKAFGIVERKKQQINAAPFAVKSFTELGLPLVLIERLEKEGISVPTEVQSAAVPTILQNHDVIIQSYTGSGKTLAYLLPILSSIVPLMNKVSKSSSDGDSGGKIGIEAVVVALSRELGMQIEEALKKNKPAIVVGTPGHAPDIGACRQEIMCRPDPNVKRTGRQLIMVSATLPFSVVRAARSWGCDPLLVQAKMKATELHGDLGKLTRSSSLKKFKNGEVRVLVTNELSARGLDVAECDLMVNLDLPTDSTHYAHRAGQIGRLGRDGTVLTICEEYEVFIVKKMEKQLGVTMAFCNFVEGKMLVKQEEKALSTSRK